MQKREAQFVDQVSVYEEALVVSAWLFSWIKCEIFVDGWPYSRSAPSRLLHSVINKLHI